MSPGYVGSSGPGAGGAAAAAIAQAIKASGAIVRVTPEDFQSILSRSEHPLVVMSVFRFFGTTYKYLTGYKGLVFFTKSSSPLQIDGRAELIAARRIWIPR
jgi:hypothetical protein